MKEYKIIRQKFSWTASEKKFEEELNNYAKQGWKVVSVYATSHGYPTAVLEKDKHR